MSEHDHEHDAAPPGPAVDRRKFLLVTLAGAAALILEACRPQTPGPTPTPTRTPSPQPSSTPQPTATATGTPVPTDVPPTNTPTAAPEATATDTPEPTPTPAPTPFPPGPPSKLGVFMGYNYPQVVDLLQTGNLAMVKTTEWDPNFVADIKRISPNTLVICRYTPLPLPDLDNWNPEQAAREFVDLLLPIATEPRRQASIDAWESLNEPTPSNADQMARLAAYEAERTRLLAAAGIRSCVGNFATGQPDLALWPAFYPALQAVQEHNGFLGLHEYSAPYMWFGAGDHQLHDDGDEGDEGWLTLRYRKVYRNYLQPAGLAVPLVITETGIDGLVGNRPGPEGHGWKDFINFWNDEGQLTSTAEGFYVEQMAWYDSELVLDDYVKGASVFTLASPATWETYEIKGLCAEILGQYLAVHPQR